MYSLEYFEEILGKTEETNEDKGEFAILAPFVVLNGKVHLLFEVRAYNLRRQPGEVCFPGGRIEKREAASECAIRETCEELRISDSRIKLIGNVGNMYSLFNEKINIFAGEISDFERKKPQANPQEVHEVFTVPFEYFAQKGERNSFNYDGHYIWGLTARAVNRIIKLCEGV